MKKDLRRTFRAKNLFDAVIANYSLKSKKKTGKNIYEPGSLAVISVSQALLDSVTRRERCEKVYLS